MNTIKRTIFVSNPNRPVDLYINILEDGNVDVVLEDPGNDPSWSVPCSIDARFLIAELCKDPDARFLIAELCKDPDALDIVGRK
jgi:hypothetical protein